MRKCGNYLRLDTSKFLRLDYPLRVMKLPHNQPSLKGYMNYVDEVLKLLIAKDIALESNTKGLYGWQQEVGPEAFVLTRYRELGGELITVGSDSHAPETVARGIPRALERLRAARIPCCDRL